jgi:hypothetical protein
MRTPKPVEININNISLGWTRTYSITPEVDRMDTSITFPDFRIGASSSALEQIDVVKQNFSNFRLDWGYNYRLINSRTGMPSKKIEINHSINKGFSPLARVNMRLKKLGIDFSYGLDLNYDSTEIRDSSLIRDSLLVEDEGYWLDKLIRASQKKTYTNTWGAGYHVDGKKGRTIKIFRDQIIEIKGDTDYSLAVRYAVIHYRFYPETNIYTGGNEDYIDRFIEVMPKMEYKFTKNIEASLFYELRRNITGRQEALSSNSKFAMEITITF